MANTIPTDITLHKQSKKLAVTYDGQAYLLSAEFLRVHSPSAEVRGHGPGQETLQIGKEQVGIDQIEPVGHYAIKIFFDDGHDTGIYTWDYLHELGERREELWQIYLNRLAQANASREP